MSSTLRAQEISPCATPHYFSPARPATLTEYSRRAAKIGVDGKTLSFTTGDGVFSKDKLDAGSRLLIETILNDETLRNSKHICDLGCGWGAVGCFLASHIPDAQIAGCDINARAAHLAALNSRSNNLKNARSWCGDGLCAAREKSFDLVACNPPIRAGNGVIQKLFDDAQRGLKIGGVLVVVIRTAQGAKSWQRKLEISFGNCQTVAIESGYRILQCVK